MDTYKNELSYAKRENKHRGVNIAVGVILGGLAIGGILYDTFKEPTLALEKTEGFGSKGIMTHAYLPINGKIIEILKKEADSIPLGTNEVKYTGIFDVKLLLKEKKKDGKDSTQIKEVRGSVVVTYPTIDQTLKK
jgi:hypothetical protein